MPLIPLVPPPATPSIPGLDNAQYNYDNLTRIIESLLGSRTTDAELLSFPYEIYNFIIRSIRDKDQNEAVGGTRLLERFLMGPQEVWVNLYNAGSQLETLFDPQAIGADFLTGLRQLVGFGKDLNYIVGNASEEELRRIIAGAIVFWRQRWLDSGITAAIRLVTGNRFKVRDYFDFRFVVGEELITEDLENDDPYVLSVKTRSLFRQGTDGETQFGADLFKFHAASQVASIDDIGGFIVIFDDTGSPSNDGFYRIDSIDGDDWIVKNVFPRAATNLSWFVAFPYDEYLTEIRVVDEKTGQGEVNRPLLENLLSLQRPNSERFNVVYIDFMDLFEVPNDVGQWQVFEGDPIMTVGNRILTLDASGAVGSILTNRLTASEWTNYTWKTKAALGSDPGALELLFLESGGDHLFASIQYNGFGTGTVRFWRSMGGLTPISAVYNFPSLNPDTYWTYTVEVWYNTVTSEQNIRFLIDGNVIFDFPYVTATFIKGNVGYRVIGGRPALIAENELWQYPLDISRVGPNP